MRFIMIGFLFISQMAWSQVITPRWEAPEILENACEQNSCTPAMKALYDGFLSTPAAPQYIPGMYSGVCYHQSEMLSPDTKHYIGLLIDRMKDTTSKNSYYMAPILQFFGDSNDMKDWSLLEARKQASPDWEKYGPMKIHQTSATQFVLNAEGEPTHVYWVRQNLQTKTIYFLALIRGFSVAFCQASPNANGLE